MLRFFKLTALAVIILAAGSTFAEDGVLYWMIDTTATVTPNGGDAISLSDYFSTFEGNSEFAARVRVSGGNISGETFLDLYYGSTIGFDDGEFGVDFEFDGTGAAYVGTPYGIQAAVPSTYSAGSPEYSFIVEIGNVTEDTWTTVASSSATYSELIASKYIHPLSDLDVPSPTQIWMPGSFQAVPEPSGGLLTMMGLALLALRRKRFAKGA